MFFSVKHDEINYLTTGRRSVIDLNDDIDRIIARHGFLDGVIIIEALHTTARVIKNENEPQFHIDLFDELDRIAPPDGDYRHDQIGTLRTVNVCDDECANGWAHIQACRFPSSTSVSVRGGVAVRGKWDRVMLFEFDRARERSVHFTLIGMSKKEIPPVSSS